VRVFLSTIGYLLHVVVIYLLATAIMMLSIECAWADVARAVVPPARGDLNPSSGVYCNGAFGHRDHVASDAKISSFSTCVQ
jgi:hypothetical protein